MKHDLKKGLNKRHIIFIALGSAIGTGLFYGSADAIQIAGPSVLLAYLIGGIAAFMVMRALGEMALYDPHPGSFGWYANNAIGPLAGFITGWTYVFELALVCLADVTAFSTYMQFWFANVSPWVWTLGISLILTGLNLCAVKMYGELEFWLSTIKIGAIIAMIVGGGLIILYAAISHNDTVGIQNLWTHGGVFPHGTWQFIESFSVVIFAFGGIEIIGLTVSEAKDVDTNIPKAINAIPFRILLFYVLSLVILMSIYPWDHIGLEGSPFVSIFHKLGINSAANVLNVVVVTAAISAINSNVYGAGRMMYGLAHGGHASKHLQTISSRGTPILAVFVMFLILSCGVILNYFYHDKLFFVIAELASFATVFVWLMILVSQFCMRIRMTKQEVQALKYPVPLWPIGPILSIAFMVFVLVVLNFIPDTRFALLVGMIWIAVLIIMYYFMKLYKRNKHQVFSVYEDKNQ